MALEVRPTDWHPDEGQLEVLVRGGLADEDENDVASHLDSCDACWNRYLAVAQRMGAESDSLSIHSERVAHEAFFSTTGVQLSRARKAATSDPSPPSVSEPVHAPMPSRIGRYRVVRQHAEGGLGQVWLAEDVRLRRRVALKRVAPERADSYGVRDRFRREAAVTARLDHPGIAPVYGLEQDAQGQWYYAMRFIRGIDLATAVHRLHALSDPVPDENTDDASAKTTQHLIPATPPRRRFFSSLEFRRLLEQFAVACDTIAYAHSRKVLHCDLKPQNIMIGPFGETLVIDWGLALGCSDDVVEMDEHQGQQEMLIGPDTGTPGEATREGAAIGTPAYMSPEQASGVRRGLTPATDIYSLGATLYNILTGCQPIERESPDAWVRLKEGCVTPPRRVNPRISRALEAICLKAMSRKSEKRYRTAGDLADELRRWLADEPVTCFRESVTTRLRRWMRDHPRLALAGASVAGAFVLTALLVFWLSRVYEQRERLLLAGSRVAEARTAVLDGDLELARQRYDEALELGHNDPAAVTLERFEVIEALGMATERDRILVQLTTDSHGSRFPGMPLALNAEGERLRDNDEQAELVFREAIQLGLPGAEVAYVEALFADNSRNAARLLRSALQQNPLHFRAKNALMAVLVFSGQFDEAEQMAMFEIRRGSRRVDLWVLLVWVATVQRDTKRVEAHLAELTKIDYELASSLRTTAHTMSDVINALPRWLDGGLGSSVLSWVKLTQQLTLLERHGQHDHVRDYILAYLPNSISRAYQPLTDINLLSQLKLNPDGAFNRLSQSAEKHPEACFYFLQGQIRLGQKRFLEAESLFLQAAENPSWLPGFAREAMFAAAMSARSEVYTRFDRKETGPEFDEIQARAVSHARKRLGMGELIPLHAKYLCTIALDAAAWDLARAIAQDQISADPESTAWQHPLMKAAFGNGDFQQAIRLADGILENTAEDADAIQLREKSWIELQKLVDAYKSTAFEPSAETDRPEVALE